MKLAVFSDQVYWWDGQTYSTDEAYWLFPASFADVCEKVVFIGRLAPEPGRKPYAFDHPGHRLCPLPYYEDLYSFWRSAPRLLPQIRQCVRANASDWDAVWICGPNPVGQLIARECVDLGCPVFLVVRQNLVRQMGFVNRGLKRVPAVVIAAWLEWRFRRLAKRRTVFVVGQEIAAAYHTVSDRVYPHFACLVRRSQLDEMSEMLCVPSENRLLCVGRLSREKGYSYLIEALALLKARGHTCALDLVGSGPQQDALARQAADLGLDGQVVQHGYVDYGPELLELYRSATALVVPSLSEGFPQVISEALCAGIPVIASAVGGIPAFLTDRETALLVPPADPRALADAIEQVLGKPDLRERLCLNSQTLIYENTLEVQRARMMRIIEEQVLPETDHRYRSALESFPGGQVPAQPAVSVVVPIYNESDHVDPLVNALLDQDYPGLQEIWLVDGMSDDGTYEALQRLQKRDTRLRVSRNPQRNQAAAINLAFSQSTGDVFMRLDAHARYAPDVVRQSVQALLKTGAGGVGAIARPLEADTALSRSIAAAHQSKFGVGVAKFRQSSARGWVDTMWNGCYWRHVMQQVGPLREDLPRSEDNDFNARVRAQGYGLYLVPEIEAYYVPRQSLKGLWQQLSANGAGIVETLFHNPQAVGLRHLAPMAFVMGLGLSLVLSVFWPPARVALATVLLVYVATLLLFTVLTWRKRPGRYVLLLPVVFVVLHVSYGLGSICGLVRPFRHAQK